MSSHETPLKKKDWAKYFGTKEFIFLYFFNWSNFLDETSTGAAAADLSLWKKFHRPPWRCWGVEEKERVGRAKSTLTRCRKNKQNMTQANWRNKYIASCTEKAEAICSFHRVQFFTLFKLLFFFFLFFTTDLSYK